jgi:TatD DNase family protein
MRYVDAHVHLSDEEYSGHIDEIMADAKTSNVVALVSNSMDLKTCVGSLRLAERYPGVVYAALGIHPWTLKTLADDEFRQILDLISEQRGNKALVAVGEVGLDFKYMNIWQKQLEVFDSMLHLAENLGLPAIIHSRGTTKQVVDMLPSYKVKKVLLHWFSSPISALPRALENGYYISEGAPTVYSNGIRDVVKKVPLSNLLTETDGPVRFFKAPFNGERTSPSFVPSVVKAVAEIKETSPQSVAKQVMKNFEAFFGVKLY